MAASSEDPFLCKLMSSLLLLFLWFIFVFLYIWKMLFGLRDLGIGALELPFESTPRPESQSVDVTAAAEAARHASGETALAVTAGRVARLR